MTSLSYQQAEQYLLTKPEAVLTYPFGDEVKVFKVKNKMFVLIGERNDLMMMNLKCDPDESISFDVA